MGKTSKTLLSILIVLGVGALIVGGTSKWFTDFSAYTSAGNKVRDWANGSTSSTSSGSSSSGSSSGTSIAAAVQIKLLTTGTDADGNETRTFSYTITPDNATNKAITTSLAWTDSTVTDAISSYYSVSVDATAMTITVTMKQRTSHQATLTVASAANPSLTSKLTIDVMRHMTKLEANSAYAGRGVTFIKTLSDDATNYVHYGINKYDIPYFDVAGTKTTMEAAITKTYDNVYSTVPTGVSQAATAAFVSSSVMFSYITGANTSSEVDYDFGSIVSGPILDSDVSFSDMEYDTLASSANTMTMAQAVSKINTKLSAMSDTKRSYLSGQLSASGRTGNRCAIVTSWTVTCKYGTDTLTLPVTCGIEIPYSSVSFDVPVTGMTTSDTGIEF